MLIFLYCLLYSLNQSKADCLALVIRIASMEFFRKIFNRKPQLKAENSHQNIYDIFSCDLRLLPDESFTPGTEMLYQVDGVKTYRKYLSQKECGLFDRVEVRCYPGSMRKNIRLLNVHFSKSYIPALQTFINNCHSIYGRDNSHYAKDEFDLTELSKDATVIRQWDGKVHQPSLLLFLNNHQLEFSIWI